jgi:hypothetical protein
MSRYPREALLVAALVSPVEHGKAMRELGWEPQPVEESLRSAARFFAGTPFTETAS